MNSKLCTFVRYPIFPGVPLTLAVGQHPAFVIIALPIARIFYIFHSNTTIIPTEIIIKILKYIIMDAQLLLFSNSIIIYSIYYPFVLIS